MFFFFRILNRSSSPPFYYWLHSDHCYWQPVSDAQQQVSHSSGHHAGCECEWDFAVEMLQAMRSWHHLYLYSCLFISVEAVSFSEWSEPCFYLVNQSKNLIKLNIYPDMSPGLDFWVPVDHGLLFSIETQLTWIIVLLILTKPGKCALVHICSCDIRCICVCIHLMMATLVRIKFTWFVDKFGILTFWLHFGTRTYNVTSKFTHREKTLTFCIPGVLHPMTKGVNFIKCSGMVVTYKRISKA